jgi:signal transduction histidine kinase
MSSAPDRNTTGLGFSLGLSLYYAAFFVIGYLAIFLFARWLLGTSIANKEREIVSDRLVEYRAWYLEGRIQELRARFEDQSQRSPDLVFVRITGPEANSIIFSNPRGQRFIELAELDRIASADQPVAATLVTKNPRNIWTVASVPVPGGHLLQAGRVSTASFRAVESFKTVFLWSIVPASLLALAGGTLLSYRAMKPARDLTSTVREILATGDLDRRVPSTGSTGDLAEMGRIFNQLLERNEGLIRAMREALDNTAHDLRTPMTRLRATAETALAGSGDLPEAREALSDCLEESERILSMLNTLMDIAEAETGAMPLQLESLDLSTLIREVVDLYEIVAEECGIRMTLDLPPTLPLQADRSGLLQVMGNLVDNALKYGVPGGTLRIRATAAAGRVQHMFADAGVGIPEEDLPRIFDRLYRGDRSRSKRGLGLGLSLVRAVVEAHGGEISVASRPGEGSCFTVTIPQAVLPPDQVSS